MHGDLVSTVLKLDDLFCPFLYPFLGPIVSKPTVDSKWHPFYIDKPREEWAALRFWVNMCRPTSVRGGSVVGRDRGEHTSCAGMAVMTHSPLAVVPNRFVSGLGWVPFLGPVIPNLRRYDWRCRDCDSMVLRYL